MKHRWAWAILILQMVIVAIGLWQTGRFHAQLTNDSPGYIQFPFGSTADALRNLRTPAYPLFLKILSSITGSYQTAPVVHYLSYCAAVTVFFSGLRRTSHSPVAAAIIAGSLLTTAILWQYVAAIGTDTVAAAAGILTMGLLLHVASGEQRTTWAVVCTVASTTLAWLIRPAYLFLIPAVPLIMTLMEIRRTSTGPFQIRSTVAYGLKSVTLICLPLIAWCLLRLWVVQSFGVVSFGGFNLVGIAGQFLTAEQIPRIPADLQPLAEQALNNRSQLPAGSLQMQDADPLNYLRMETNYDVTIWSMFEPAARQLYGDDDNAVNTQLRKIATAILKLVPGKYVIWLIKSFRHGIYKILSDFIVNPYGLLITLLAAFATLTRVLRPTSRSGTHPEKSLQSTTELLFTMTLTYSLTSLALTITVCPPLGRLTDAAAILLAPLMTSVALNQIVAMFSKEDNM